MSRFSDDQIRRYSRQILLREVGGRGQTRIGAARPVLFCAAGVGQVAAEYLWRAGVTELGLLATTAAESGRLTRELTATGYPGAPAQPISAAAASFEHLARAAPDCTLLWLSAEEAAKAAGESNAHPTLLWACCRGRWGAVGQGMATLQATVAEPPDAATAGSESGPGAMIIGSALALFALQKILATAPAATMNPEAIWRIDLTSAELPVWR